MPRLKRFHLKKGIQAARHAPPKKKLKRKKPKHRPVLRHSLLDELASYAPVPAKVDRNKVLAELRKYLQAAARAKKLIRERNLRAERVVRLWGKAMLSDRGRKYLPALRADGRIEIRLLEEIK